MQWNGSLTERTTALTDVVIVVVALWCCRHAARARAPLWAGAFGAVALTAVCGAVVHGLAWETPASQRGFMLIGLGLLAAIVLFTDCAVRDCVRHGGARWLPGCGVIATLIVIASARHGGAADAAIFGAGCAAMAFALGVYGWLALRRRVGALWVAVGLLLTTFAGYAQARPDWGLVIVWPFDHNGLFHLLEIAALPLLARGCVVMARAID